MIDQPYYIFLLDAYYEFIIYYFFYSFQKFLLVNILFVKVLIIVFISSFITEINLFEFYYFL